MARPSMIGHAGDLCLAPIDRVWTLQELDILQELPTPIVILLYEVNRGVAQHSCQLLFENVSFLRRFGLPRSQVEYSDVWNRLSDTEQGAKWSSITKILQDNKICQASMEVHELLRPLFWKADAGLPQASANINSKMLYSAALSNSAQAASLILPTLIQSARCCTPQPIKIQTAAGSVETAVLHLFDMQPLVPAQTPAPVPSTVASPSSTSAADMRVCALHQRSPIHMYIFDSKGALLIANKAASEGLQSDASQPNYASGLKALFDRGTYPGGQGEADGAYAEALNACFDLEVEVHQHVQPYTSRKDGKLKWALLEMWPVPDPVDSSPAVLVHRYSITQQRRLQNYLMERNEVLQKQNQALERDWQSMLDEKFRLQQESKALSQHLNALLNEKFGPRDSKGFDSDTPIDKALAFLQFIIAGYCPPVQAALKMYRMLSEPGIDLRQPVRLEKQLLKAHVDMDTEVGASMLQLLQGKDGSQIHKSDEVKRDEQAGAGRRAGAASAFSRHPDLAEAPVATDSTDEADASPAPQRQNSATAAPAFVPLPVTPAVERMLQDAENNWQFDIFGFADATQGNSLSMLGFHLIQITGLLQEFGLNATKMAACFRKIESGYSPTNPYHNSIHVASVLQMTHMLLVHGGVLKSGVMERMHQLGSYCSAIVHDYEHSGVNNDFLIKTAHPLSITYNDSSPWENHHLPASSRVLYQPEFCFCPKEMAGQMIHMRSIFINQVLGTDMKKHFDSVSRFQAAFKDPPASPGAPMDPSRVGSSGKNWDSFKSEDKTLIYQMILKCADIGHLTASPRIHKRWALQLEEEFFRQCCIHVLYPLMDRNEKGGMTRSQLGFFNIVGAPLFLAVIELFDEAQPMMQGLQANYHQWESGTIADLKI